MDGLPAKDSLTLTTMQELGGLNPPRIQGSGDVVRGHNKAQMRKDRKHCRHLWKATQGPGSKWTIYQGDANATRPIAHTMLPQS
jgi:hypothetical protein